MTQPVYIVQDADHENMVSYQHYVCVHVYVHCKSPSIPSWSENTLFQKIP